MVSPWTVVFYITSSFINYTFFWVNFNFLSVLIADSVGPHLSHARLVRISHTPPYSIRAGLVRT